MFFIRSGAIAQTAQSRPRVLIVEDDRAIANLISQVVTEQPGLDVEIAHTGREALDVALLSDRPLDLLILDLRVPEVGGEELIRDLDQAGLRPAVLVVSAGSEQEVTAAARRVHAYAVVRKPFELADLEQKVHEGIEMAQKVHEGPEMTAGRPRRVPVHRRVVEATQSALSSDADILAERSRELLERSREVVDNARKLTRPKRKRTGNRAADHPGRG
jgi:DNA-binding response OmpR family regulator